MTVRWVHWVCPECGYQTRQPDHSTQVICYRTLKHKNNRTRIMKKVEDAA
jgi:hypothetical protein